MVARTDLYARRHGCADLRGNRAGRQVLLVHKVRKFSDPGPVGSRTHVGNVVRDDINTQLLCGHAGRRDL